MSRVVRNTVLTAKLETAYGTDAVPTAAANAILTSQPRITPLNSNNVDRDLVRPYIGGSEQLVGTRSVQCEFVCELAGPGTPGTAPPVGALLRMCAMAEVLTASTRADYTPITDGQESGTLYWFDSGVRHMLTGARGNAQIRMNSGERPEIAFTFQGLHSLPTTATPGTVDFSSWRTPLVVTDANTGDVTFGGTVSATGAPAITGGTAYPSMGLELDLGNAVQFTPLLGGESVDITARALDGRVRLSLTAAQEVALYTSVLNAQLQAVSLLHGTAAGNRVLVHQPTVQLYDVTKEDLNGKRLVGYRTRGVPTPGGGGNDELRIVFF